VTAEKGDFAAALAGELTQSLLVVPSGHIIHAQHPLVEVQWRVGCRIVRDDSAHATAGRMDILTTNAGIDHHQPVAVCLNQQAVSDQVRLQAFTESIIDRDARRAHTATVKVVNFRWTSLRSSAKSLRDYDLSGAQHISVAIECSEGCHNRRSGEADNRAKKPVIRQKAEN